MLTRDHKSINKTKIHLGVTYQTSVDDNKYFGWGAVTDNPNDPRDTFHRSISMFGEVIIVYIRYMVVDSPLPLYKNKSVKIRIRY